MSGVGTAIVGSALIGSYASGRAADAQADAARAGAASQETISRESLELQRELAETQRQDFQPWREAGEQALAQIQQGIASGAFEVGDIDVTKDPGYQFRMDQGAEALDKSAAARGRLLSGAQQKALNTYGQEMGSQEYARAYAREADKKARKFNILSGLSQGGQSSAAGQAQSTSQLAQTSGNILSNLGISQNVAQQNVGAARAGAYQGQAQAANQGIQNWMLYNALQPTGGA